MNKRPPARWIRVHAVRWPATLAVLLIGGMVTLEPAAGQAGQTELNGRTGRTGQDGSSGTTLRREGETIRDPQGRFKVVGDRVEFVPSDESAPLIVLENLALQRVSQELIRLGEGVHWSIEGTVTEYQGSNYLMLNRVVIRTTATTE